MITKRDLGVAAFTLAATWGVAAMAQQTPAQRLHSSAFDWTAMTAKDNAYGSVRSVVRAPTVTLDELEMHITTLNAGQTSHAPHQHPNEELIILREGTVEALVHGEWKRLGPGSIIFQASNELHGIKNVGATPATYHVVNWRTTATPAK
ncbi:MAG TPA: cupin domain-containing protein [Vicinamibacterales bacterium]|jgi:quercetin dioxygenase-like cupin family protein